ncbi:MAG: single-stranded-DNA-specific exonuclease RecJ [Deltaproteobacteria bacterium]
MNSLFLGHGWHRRPLDRDLAKNIASRTGITFPIAAILVQRGITTPDDAIYHLTPSLSSLNDPYAMADMERAVERVIAAVEARERVAVFGDYDADGVSASIVLSRFLKGLGLDVSVYIPHREKEGYGLNPDALSRFSSEGRTLVITVDCGVSNHDEIAHARTLGMDVIVTDHHEPPPYLPPALAVLNPKRPDCTYPFRELAGVGVAFTFVRALRSRLHGLGFWNGRTVPNLKEYLDLVAIGTVADMVPLLGDNRILVRTGLEVLGAAARPGIASLLATCSITPPLSVDDIAFRIAPRINAAGRMNHARTAQLLLETSDPGRAADLAAELHSLNEDRQREEGKIFEEAQRMIQALGERPAYVCASAAWKRGVLGISASRLSSSHLRPVILFTFHEGTAYGSARSPEGIDLMEALRSCASFLDGYGGHQSAAGLHLPQDRLPAFTRAFEEVIHAQIGRSTYTPVLPIDLSVSVQEIASPEFSRLYPLLEPFGTGYPPPVLAIQDFHVRERRLVGNGHLKLRLGSHHSNGPTLDLLAWGHGDKADLSWDRMEIACTPSLTVWNGKRQISLRLKDARPRNGDVEHEGGNVEKEIRNDSYP